jgi:NAD+ kinase
MKIHFLHDNREKSKAVFQRYVGIYGQSHLEDAQVFVVLGGDGFMLHSMHQYYHYEVPFYGLNFGHVGFLLNTYDDGDLIESLAKAHRTALYPLYAKVQTISGEIRELMAINELSLMRQTHQAVKIEIVIDGATRIAEMVADGVLLATPAGSTAYNASIGGPIIPLDSNLLVLTPISPFRPRRWRGALIKKSSQVIFRVLDPEKRAVSATADSSEVNFVQSVHLHEDLHNPIHLMFDPNHQLEERIFLEQFL